MTTKNNLIIKAKAGKKLSVFLAQATPKNMGLTIREVRVIISTSLWKIAKQFYSETVFTEQELFDKTQFLINQLQEQGILKSLLDEPFEIGQVLRQEETISLFLVNLTTLNLKSLSLKNIQDNEGYRYLAVRDDDSECEDCTFLGLLKKLNPGDIVCVDEGYYIIDDNFNLIENWALYEFSC